MRKLTADKARLINQLKRRNINPMVEAELLGELLDGALTQDEAALALGYSQPRIANSLRLLQLSDFLQELIRKGALNFSDGKALASLPPADAERLADMKIRNRWTTRDLEESIRSEFSPRESPRRRGRKPAFDHA